MEKAFLFVHFREKETPEGEQVYFSLSRDGYEWESLNGGNPVLYSDLGEGGVRDMAIAKNQYTGTYVILATDLSLSRNFKSRYEGSWDKIRRGGSPYLIRWESKDLVHWGRPSQVKMPSPAGHSFGCVWAPDIAFDRESGDYLVHWSSPLREEEGPFRIYYARTRDFLSFSEPGVLYEEGEGEVIDSALLYEGGRYYLFVKQEGREGRIHLLSSEKILGPYEKIPGFYDSMEPLERGVYEGATAIQLPGGEWALFLDYYGRPGEAQGYRMLTGELSTGSFAFTDRSRFPFGFKHGTVMEIGEEEYVLLKGFWEKA